VTTYYQILQISSGATIAEIEAAYEAQYNHWRRLVTHHDPNMVNKANQALQSLEKMRATLTDPVKRETYDASIGLRGPMGGLADPQARPRATVPTPPPPRARVGSHSPPAPTTGERVDAWVCSKCQTANAIGHQYCQKCGHQIGRQCPKCDTLVEMQTEFCSNCGIDIKRFIQEQEVKKATQLRLQREMERKMQQEREQTRRMELIGIKIWVAIQGTFLGLLGNFIACIICYHGWDGILSSVYLTSTFVVGGIVGLIASLWAGILVGNRSDFNQRYMSLSGGTAAVLASVLICLPMMLIGNAIF
jgi:hypothetical protein